MAIINGTSVGGMTLQADYSYTQNTSANTSTVTVTLKLANHYALYASALSGSYISVGGSKTNYSKDISYGGSTTTTTTLATKTATVTHNSDGTATCNISGTFVMNGTYRGYSVGTMTVSQTVTLPKIARSSSFTISSSVNTGSAISGNVTPSSSAFNHKLLLKIGSTTKATISMAVGTTAFSYTIPHDWFPSSTSGTITAVLETYNGTTLVASTSKNITANIPSSITPSISWFGLNAAYNDLGGQYVQNKTSADLSIVAQAGSGASIASYAYNGPGFYVVTTDSVVSTGLLSSSGVLVYTVQVTDTRGRTASATTEFYVNAYSTPSIGPVYVQRCDANGNLSQSGTYAIYTINSSYSSIAGKNTRTVTAAYSSNNGSTYSAETTLQASTDTASTKTGVYGGGAFAVANTYMIRFTITDAYGATNTITVPLKAAERPMNIKLNGKGIGIGKMAETDNLLDCAWNIKTHGSIETSEYAKLTGYNYLGIADLNNIKEPGMYGVYNSTNAPTSDIATLEVVKYSPDWIVQRFTTAGVVRVYMRSWYGGTTWGNWVQMYDNTMIRDYVFEYGTYAGWEYYKWASGKIELFSEQTLSFPAGTQQTDNLYRSIVSLDLSGIVTKIMSGTCSIQTNGMVPQVCRNSTNLAVAEIVIVTSRTIPAFTITAPVYIVGKWA